MNITAKYEGGVFRPLEEVTVQEGTLVEVRLPSNGARFAGKPGPVQSFAFFGMWRDRTDIDDSVEYVNRLRSQLRG